MFRKLINNIALSSSPSRFTGRGRGMGPDLPIQNYTDIGKIPIWAQNYLFALAVSTKVSK